MLHFRTACSIMNYVALIRSRCERASGGTQPIFVIMAATRCDWHMLNLNVVPPFHRQLMVVVVVPKLRSIRYQSAFSKSSDSVK